jgi:hypothetical protein
VKVLAARAGTAFATALLGLSIVWSSYRAVGAARAMVVAPAVGEAFGSGISRHLEIPVSGVAGEAVFDEIGRAPRAVVFVYTGDCAYSNANLWNWIDLLVGAPTGVPIFAVTPDADLDDALFWGGLAGRLRLARVGPEAIVRRLDVYSTPTTLIVESGTVIHQFQGVLSGPSKQRLTAFLGSDVMPSATS